MAAAAVAVCGNPLANLKSAVDNFSEEAVKEAREIADELAGIIVESSAKLEKVKRLTDQQKSKSYKRTIQIQRYGDITTSWSELIYKKDVINEICIALLRTLGTRATVSEVENEKISKLRKINSEFQVQFQKGSWHPLRGIKQRYDRQNDSSTFFGSKRFYMMATGIVDKASRYLTTDPDVEAFTKLSNPNNNRKDEQLEALSQAVSNFREKTINNINRIEKMFKSLASDIGHDLEGVIEETDGAKSAPEKIDINIYEELGKKWANLINLSETMKDIYLILVSTANTTIGNFPKIRDASIRLEKVFEEGCQHSLSGLLKRYETESSGLKLCGSEDLYNLVSSIFARINRYIRKDPDVKIRAKLMGKDSIDGVLALDDEEDDFLPEREPLSDAPPAE